jgi:hypothetical protein
MKCISLLTVIDKEEKKWLKEDDSLPKPWRGWRREEGTRQKRKQTTYQMELTGGNNSAYLNLPECKNKCET